MARYLNDDLFCQRSNKWQFRVKNWFLYNENQIDYDDDLKYMYHPIQAKDGKAIITGKQMYLMKEQQKGTVCTCSYRAS